MTTEFQRISINTSSGGGYGAITVPQEESQQKFDELLKMADSRRKVIRCASCILSPLTLVPSVICIGCGCIGHALPLKTRCDLVSLAFYPCFGLCKTEEEDYEYLTLAEQEQLLALHEELDPSPPVALKPANLKPLLQWNDQYNREKYSGVLDPIKELSLINQKLQQIEQTALTRKRVVRCACDLLCPLTCPLEFLCFICQMCCADPESCEDGWTPPPGARNRGFESQATLPQKMGDLCCLAMDPVRTMDTEKEFERDKGFYLYPPERQRMTEHLSDRIFLKQLSHLQPFIEGIHANRDILDITLGYL